MRLPLPLLLLLLLCARVAAAATVTSSCTAATGWATTPTNALALDGAFAQTTVTLQPLLSVTTCAMAVPTGATINGVQVRVVGCGAGTTAQRAINVNLLGLGTCTAKSALAQAQCATLTDQTVGGVADTWSCSGPVTDTAVNATAFGASVQTNTSNSASTSIDLVSLTVTYTGGGTTTTTLAGGGADTNGGALQIVQ